MSRNGNIINPPGETRRQRTTYRLSNANYDYVYQRAAEMGIEMNAAINVIVQESRKLGSVVQELRGCAEVLRDVAVRSLKRK